MSQSEGDDPVKPGILAKGYAAAKTVYKLKHFILTAATTTLGYYTIGAPHPTWPLSTALLCALARYSSETASAERRLCAATNEGEPIDVNVEIRKARRRMEGLVRPDPKGGPIVETEFRVKQRGLEGLLRDNDREETGGRTIKAEWSCHQDVLHDDRGKVLLYFHGGAYCFLSPRTHRHTCMALSKELGRRVLSVDYRLSPETRFPGAVHDAVSAYFYLTEDLGIAPKDILVAGDSAGGNLASSLLLYLRDSGLAQVAGGILLSPWVDFTASFKSWDLNKLTDYLAIDPTDPLCPPGLYVPSEPYLAHPYVSQAFMADFSHLPPLFVLAGGNEVLLDEITLYAQRADQHDVDVTHEIFEGGVHVFVSIMEQMGWEGYRSIGRWAKERFTVEEAEGADRGNQAWRGVEESLLDVWEVKRRKLGIDTGEAGTGRLDSSSGNGNGNGNNDTMRRPNRNDRFVWEYTTEEAPTIQLRRDSPVHPLARKAYIANNTERKRHGLTRVVRAKKNPEFTGRLFHL
ncbi:hypothetical protein JCM10212_001292 [Sporobolomyces blumeae]